MDVHSQVELVSPLECQWSGDVLLHHTWHHLFVKFAHVLRTENHKVDTPSTTDGFSQKQQRHSITDQEHTTHLEQYYTLALTGLIGFGNVSDGRRHLVCKGVRKVLLGTSIFDAGEVVFETG